MNIIIEGPDGVGKTSLCEKLAVELSAPLYKAAGAGSPPQMISAPLSQAEDAGAWGVALTMPHDIDIIFDRAFPSEYCYGTVFERSEMNVSAIWALDKAVAESSHVAVLIAPRFESSEEVSFFLKERGVGDVNADEWLELLRFYDDYVRNSYMDWVVIDGPDLEYIAKAVRGRRKDKVHRVTKDPFA